MSNLIWTALGVWLGMNLVILALVAHSARRGMSGGRRDASPGRPQGG